MRLLTWIEVTLGRLEPNVARVASLAASVASVMASLSWLVGKALVLVRSQYG
mgnify:CR=1 FL=1